MPSANPKLEKQASTEATEPIRQAITVIEHKIRNLEKRKGKLESYKDLQKNGGELNADQKTAVAKYDEVLQTLDNTREMYKTIVGIANDAAKQQKKLARKEAAERMQQDIAKVREVLIIQETLTNMGNENVRGDFLAGSNGAVKLTEEELKYLDDFYNETTVKHQRQESQPSFQQQMQKVAEHYVAIVEGKQREIVGTTYNKIKEIVTSITRSGYFDRINEVEVLVDEVTESTVEVQLTDATTQEQSNEEHSSGDRHIPPPESIMPMPNFPVQVAPLPVVSGATPVSAQIPVVAQPVPPHPTAPVETSYYTNAPGFVPAPQQTQPTAQQSNQQSSQQQSQQQQAPRINDVIGTPNFFFLQESELDSPDVTTQQPQPAIVSHIPPTVNAPIPTQTFTNQNFAGAPVVAQQVIYQHQPPQEMPHIPGFANPNPPPPIPMPPSHQQPNLQYSPQHPAGFQQPPQDQTIGQMPQQSQSQFEQSHRQDGETQANDSKVEQDQNETSGGQTDLSQANDTSDWGADNEATISDWNQPDDAQQSQDSQSQQPQQAWGEQRSGYRGRGGRRGGGGNSNGYSGRPRTGGYQQNGRSSGQGGAYYRNDGSSSYQNGYHQRNWGNNGGTGGGASSGGNINSGGGGYNSGFKRTGGGGGPRGGPGGPRGDRGTDRSDGRGGQFRGGQQRSGGSRGGGYASRPKPQAQQQ